ncbi:MAG TPA: DUF6600 domain-containing protein [Polyangiaceae bacterium]|jgi:hypothetical protein
MVRARGVVAVLGGALLLAPALAGAQSEGEQGTPVDVPEGDEYADTDPDALTDFRPALDPHGTWADDPAYGTVWTPSPDEVGADFEPYVSAGHWDYVDGDYVWVSDYSWGWVSFHYGRWVLSAGRWLWIPGRLYAGAWVTWSVGDDEYADLGWAPMPPAWIWIGGGAVGVGFAAPEPWAFCGYGDVFSPALPSRVVVGDRAAPLAGHMRPYVRARPTVAGQALAQPVMHGPSPALLGIDPARIQHASPSLRELRARQYAHPSTALPLGARAPSPHVVRPAPRPFVPRAGQAPARGAGRGRR